MDAIASQSVQADSRPSNLRMDKDLIIYKADYPFKVYDNRWAVSHEVTHCRALLAYTIDPKGVLPMNKEVLRRLKLYGASVEQSTAILNYLKMNNSLEQLEIDTLRLPLTNIVDPNNTFKELRVLSIDEVRLVDRSGRELVGIVPNKCIAFNAPQLTNVYLGSNSIDFVEFTNYQSITCLTYGFTQSPLTANLLSYVNLERLTCEEYHDSNSAGILRLVNQPLGRLVYLDISLTRAKSGSEVIPQDRVHWLQSLFYAFYFAANLQLMRPAMVNACHFYGVQLRLLDGQVNYHKFAFGEHLLRFHHSHFGDSWRWLTLPEFPSVTRVDYLDVFDLWGHHLQLKSPAEEPHRGFQRFARLYPNIQTVVLNNSKTNDTKLSSGTFLSFLRTCRSLNILFIQFSRFEGPFYDRLAKLPSLADLKCLTVNEGAGTQLEHPINFGLLLDSLTQLTCMTTNLVTRNAMLRLVARKPMRMAVLDFRFWTDKRTDKRTDEQATDNTWYHFTFIPTSVRKAEYKLRVAKAKDVAGKASTFFLGPVSANVTEADLERLDINKYAVHWLDQSTLP